MPEKGSDNRNLSFADVAWQDLKTLLDARINAGLNGQVSAKSIAEIVQDEMETANSRPAQ